MKRFSEQLHTKAMSLTLKAAERRELRERLVAYMEYHPRQQGAVSKAYPPIRSALFEPYRVLSFKGFSIARWSVAVVLCIGIVTSYAAEDTVPGDTLYAVKVRFNEEVRSTLALNSYEKVTWETERLNRRIAEARILASTGKLTPEVERAVVVAVQKHSDNARREIAELKETDVQEAALASIQLASALDVQAISLQVDEDQSGEAIVAGTVLGKKPGAALLALVVAESVKSTQLDVNEELPSYERLLARLEADTTRARELLLSVSEVARSEERIDTTRRLEDIERSMATAMAADDETDVAARKILFTAIHRVQKLIVFMANIDVRETTSLESIVPVVLTDEERRNGIENNVREMNSGLTQISASVKETELTAALSDKVGAATKRSAELASSTAVMLAGNDLSGAAVLSVEGRDLVRDTLALLGIGAASGSVDKSLSEPRPAATTTPGGQVEGASAATSSAATSSLPAGIKATTTSAATI